MWLTMAVSKGYVLSRRHVRLLLSLVFQLARVPCKDPGPAMSLAQKGIGAEQVTLFFLHPCSLSF